MAKPARKKIAKKKPATDAELIAAGLFDRDPYAGMSPTQRRARHAAEEAQRPRNMLQERLRTALGFEVSGPALRSHLESLSPFLLRAFLTNPESQEHAKRLVLDTAVANIARFGKRSVALHKTVQERHERIAAEVKTVSDDLSDGGTKKVRKKVVDARVAANLCKAGLKVDARTIRRVRTRLGA